MRYGTQTARTAPRRRGAEARPAPARHRLVRKEGAASSTSVAGYLVHHWRCLGHSMGYIARTPLASLMTVAVIGISLALPAGMYVLLNNVRHVTAGWDSAVQISLFLKKDVGTEAARRLMDELKGMGGVGAVEYISPSQALDEFRRFSGFGDALQALQSNPLPAVLVVHPSAVQSRPGDIRSLAARLRAFPQVDQANLDMQWVERLYAVMDIAKRAILIVAGLFGIGVLLIVGNTIRLTIHNRREEIEIKKLIGATNAFIRRPFLYYGWWYGVLGGVAACALVDTGVWLMQGPVQRLSLFYGGNFTLHALDLEATCVVLLCATLLGYLGAWLAVGRHLNAIEPS